MKVPKLETALVPAAKITDYLRHEEETPRFLTAYPLRRRDDD